MGATPTMDGSNMANGGNSSMGGMGGMGGMGDGMLSYLHQRVYEIVLFKSWTPDNNGEYVATIIAVIGIGFFSMLLKAMSTGLITTWNHKPSPAPGQCEHCSPEHQAASAYDAHVAGPWWFLWTWKQFKQALVTSCFIFPSTVLDFCTMLIAMTFNVGLIMAVSAGYVLGTVLLIHGTLENYTARLKVMSKANVQGVSAKAVAAAETPDTPALDSEIGGCNANVDKAGSDCVVEEDVRPSFRINGGAHASTLFS
jgi:hypothetical protein